jgi:hypothetical protein
VRKLLAICLLLLPLCCIHAQEQERKLVDRIMKPDMGLANDAQNKKFTADRTSVNKRAQVNTFYVQQGSRAKSFSGTGEFSAKQFGAATYNNGDSAVARNLSDKNAQSWTYSAASKSHHTGAAYDQKKAQSSRDYAGNRPYLEQGKSQKFLNRKNRPMTINEVRDLLNKNK